MVLKYFYRTLTEICFIVFLGANMEKTMRNIARILKGNKKEPISAFYPKASVLNLKNKILFFRLFKNISYNIKVLRLALF